MSPVAVDGDQVVVMEAEEGIRSVFADQTHRSLLSFPSQLHKKKSVQNCIAASKGAESEKALSTDLLLEIERSESQWS